MKNDTVIEFTRDEILKGLRQLPDRCGGLFLRMYSLPHLYLNRTLHDCVHAMPTEKLDWALTQVQNSLKAKREGRLILK